MSIKYNEFGEVISVNGLTTGHHIGKPMQDAAAERPEDNEAYGTQHRTMGRTKNCNEDEQPKTPGGASSWNDLRDKPFYSEETEVVLCVDRKISFSSATVKTSIESDMPFFVARQTYKVLLDDTCYVCVAFVGNSGMVWIGNPSYVDNGGEDNGMPFAMSVGYHDEIGGNCLIFNRGKGELEKIYCITITTMAETVHPIEPKYLPCDLMFKVGCTGTTHPKLNPDKMTKPTIVSGSLEAVLEKLANGEIPVVKVQYMGAWDKNYTFPTAYGGEFTCNTWRYSSAVMFDHLIANCGEVLSVRISMDLDDPDFMELRMYCHSAGTSPLVIS